MCRTQLISSLISSCGHEWPPNRAQSASAGNQSVHFVLLRVSTLKCLTCTGDSLLMRRLIAF